MMNIYQLTDTEILLFFMVFVGLSSFAVSWLVFGVETVGTHVKILFALTYHFTRNPKCKKEEPSQVSNGQANKSFTHR